VRIRSLSTTAVLAGVMAQVAQAQAAACVAVPGAPRLDHAVVVVRNLDSAAARFHRLGFRSKLGRLHPDSILNRHIKFRDGTGIELMTVVGRPTDRTAEDYADLLATGEKGVYAALWTTDMARIVAQAKRAGLPRRSTRLGASEFLSFPGARDAAPFFFGAGGAPSSDPDSVVAHENGSVSLEAAWVEAGPRFERLLRALGSRPCESVPLPDGRSGTRWPLARGSLVLVRARAGGEPRVLGVEIRRAPAFATPRRAPVEPLPGFWLLLR
jgi:hypothetical protein